jgi:aryl-alcohol dehydrogenase-like predicted oxidoreductase
MESRPYGASGFSVSAVGLGAGQLGDARLDETAAAALIHGAIDAGVTLVDTAPGYGLSEQRLGRHLGARRDRIVLSTKLGYGVAGVPDWTGPCITAGVEQALRTLRTDRLEIAHLHSCPRAVLEHGEVVDALERARATGKVRAIAYSGDNDALDFALASGRYDGLMASVNVCDQGVVGRVLDRIQNPSLVGEISPAFGRSSRAPGFIAKRPVANHPWRFADVPRGDYCETYWHRWRTMAVPDDGLAPGERALRFTLSLPGVASAIVGTTKLAHLLEAVAWAGAGPLPAASMAALRAAWTRHGADWDGEV